MAAELRRRAWSASTELADVFEEIYRDPRIHRSRDAPRGMVRPNGRLVVPRMFGIRLACWRRTSMCRISTLHRLIPSLQVLFPDYRTLRIFMEWQRCAKKLSDYFPLRVSYMTESETDLLGGVCPYVPRPFL